MKTATETLTFLFTDIEGSTASWERAGGAMARALARHDRILQNAIERRGGTVFKTIGDAFCAVFADAAVALEASLEGQRELESEPWPPDCPILVRIAIHSGAAEEREGDYFGPTLNRIARLLSISHGGQVLLSGTARELAQDSLPRDVQLIDLGQHYLRGLTRPERVYQMVAPGLRSRFPALASARAHPNNLPSQLTSFVGRATALNQVEELIAHREVRVLTLTGPGGTGKTRLAIKAAEELLEHFRDGAFLIPLASVTHADLIAPAIAGALGIEVLGSHEGAEAVKSYLRERKLLLVLDNLEQVEGAAPVVADLLTTCPALTILVTSREVLHVYGEQVVVLSPMATPEPDALPPPDELDRFDAIALFVQRAQAARSDFALNADNARDVVEICRRLDGLPLAIELAAARIRLFPPHALLPRLSDRLKLLTGGGRDLPARQQTLRGAIDWSHDLLRPEEKDLFACLSVFSGGCTFEAVEVVCGNRVPDVLEALTSLIEKSLVREEADGEPRFNMLESIREYAAERLEAMSDADAVRSDHARYYAGLDLWGNMFGGVPSRREQIVYLDREHPNLLAAWEWLRRHDQARAVVLGTSLARYWGLRGRWGDVIRFADDVQEHGSLLPVAERARAFDIAGLIIETYGDHERAALLYDQSYGLRRESGDTTAATEAVAFRAWKGITAGDAALSRQLFDEGFAAIDQTEPDPRMEEALKWLCATAQRLGMYERAELLARQGLTLARKRDNMHDVAARLGDLGDIALKTGDLAKATPFFEESLQIRRSLNDLNCIPHSLEGLGRIALEQGDPETARTLLMERLEIAQKTGSPSQLARSLDLMGHAELAAGDHREAREFFRKCLPLAEEVGELVTVADALWGLVAVSAAEGSSARAVRLAGAASAVQRASGEQVPSIDQARNERYLAGAAGGLEQESRDRLLQEGSETSREGAVTYALEAEA
jgi:predicted ATPase/class 3 adenylate cyclase